VVFNGPNGIESEFLGKHGQLEFLFVYLAIREPIIPTVRRK